MYIYVQDYNVGVIRWEKLTSIWGIWYVIHDECDILCRWYCVDLTSQILGISPGAVYGVGEKGREKDTETVREREIKSVSGWTNETAKCIQNDEWSTRVTWASHTANKTHSGYLAQTQHDKVFLMKSISIQLYRNWTLSGTHIIIYVYTW